MTENLQTVITSYLHMEATVTMRGRDNKGTREKESRLVADLSRP